MQAEITCQGRTLCSSELKWLRSWLSNRREKSRHQLSLELCDQWQWRTATGRPKNYAARSFLLKLEQRNLITLPPIRATMRRRSWHKSDDLWGAINTVSLSSKAPITVPLGSLLPLSIEIPPSGSREEKLFRTYLATHHYLGFGRTVGENQQYIIRDRFGRDLACLLFGSAAWKTQARDDFIGWDNQARVKCLNQITNNTRFLILPWVKIPNVASHILSIVLHRLSCDWQKKYAHPIHLVETFVEKDRFRGTCYKAANWIYVGETKGRSRQDRHQTLSVPVKDIYLYPLYRRFREVLC